MSGFSPTSETMASTFGGKIRSSNQAGKAKAEELLEKMNFGSGVGPLFVDGVGKAVGCRTTRVGGCLSYEKRGGQICGR